MAWRHHQAFFLCLLFVFYSCKMDMSSLHNGGTQWHFLGCCTLNQRDQQYVECQHGDIWFPFHSYNITAGTPADITVLPKLALGLSDFSFHFNVFRNNTCFKALCETSAASWYFDYLREVWLNKGDLVSVTFSISLWRQTGKGSQSSARWTWGDWQSGGCLGLF